MTNKKLRRIKKYFNADDTRTRRSNYLYFCQSYIYANLDLALQWVCKRRKYGK